MFRAFDFSTIGAAIYNSFCIAIAVGITGGLFGFWLYGSGACREGTTGCYPWCRCPGLLCKLIYSFCTRLFRRRGKEPRCDAPDPDGDGNAPQPEPPQPEPSLSQPADGEDPTSQPQDPSPHDGNATNDSANPTGPSSILAEDEEPGMAIPLVEIRRATSPRRRPGSVVASQPGPSGMNVVCRRCEESHQRREECPDGLDSGEETSWSPRSSQENQWELGGSDRQDLEREDQQELEEDTHQKSEEERRADPDMENCDSKEVEHDNSGNDKGGTEKK